MGNFAIRGMVMFMSFCALSAGVATAADGPRHQVGSNDYIQQWLICGPLPNPANDNQSDPISRLGYKTDYLKALGGEARARPVAGAAVDHDGQKLAFRLVESDQPILDLSTQFEQNANRIAYAYTTLVSDAEQTVYLHLGSDDGAKVWLNGKVVLDVFMDRGTREHDNIIEATLRKGDNPLLVKVDQAGGGWGLVVQPMTETGHGEYVRQVIADRAQVTFEQSGPMGRNIKVAASANIPIGKALADELVQWQVKDARGKVVAEATGQYGQATSIELPASKGFYTIHAEAPGMNLSQQTSCLLAEDREAELAKVREKARRHVDAEADSPYAGWIAYRLLLADEAAEREGPTSGECTALTFELHDWMRRLGDNPLPKMRGGFEWAYRCSVDGTGQPFSIFVPDDYDPAKAWPLKLDLHGRSGTHTSWVQLTDSHPEPYFRVHVMGRARGGGYVKLSEVDVLEALAYVRKHWNIDPDRIMLSGGSMGGGGTFRMASRHPHLFASARPVCGYGSHLPIENVLNVPLFSIHSDDDWVVPIVLSRLATHTLAMSGGRAVQHETTGFGHGVHGWTEGIAAGQAWEEVQIKPDRIDHIRYTATDELASRAYWARLIKWGPRARPARFELRTGPGNELYADLQNVGTLEVDLTEAPVDRSKPLTIFEDLKLITKLDAPLPGKLYLSVEGDNLTVSAKAPAAPEYRLHFPGGAPAMYHGEPLMIVWGTTGDAKTTEALQHAATIAAKACGPAWYPDEMGNDYPMENTLFGALPVKADRDVTEADMKHYNLLLLGDAKQNKLVAKIADKLPVKVEAGKVTSNDGLTWSLEDRAMGLLHYNPLQPKRLVYWLVAGDPINSLAGAQVMRHQRWAPASPDLVITGTTGWHVVAQRNFDADWQWEPGYQNSPRLPEALGDNAALTQFMAEAARQANDADFALIQPVSEDEPAYIAVGETRLADLTGLPFTEPIVWFDITREQLIEHLKQLQAKRDAGNDGVIDLHPKMTAAELAKSHQPVFRISAEYGWMMSDYTRQLEWTPARPVMNHVSINDAMRRHFYRTKQITEQLNEPRP